jgi:ferric-dicitrate binding protein FerR (iron transport regulator)
MPTPETLWQRLVDEAGDDAIDSAASVSVTQAERDLVAAGFDVKAERAHANAQIEELTGKPRSTDATRDPAIDGAAWVSAPAPSPRRSPASRRIVWLVAALVGAATAGGIFYAAAHRPNPPDKPVEAPSATAAPERKGPPIAPKEPLPSPEKPTGEPEDWKIAPPRPHGN